MDVTVENTDHLNGVVSAPPSKAYTHRMLIAASLSNGTSKIFNPLVSDDTQATLEAVKEFGAETETHLREEYSTHNWILEGLLERAGFEIEHSDYKDGFFASYLCIKR